MKMKREHELDDDRGNRHKRPRPDGFTEAIQQGKFELRLLVSSKAAGALIGKGGENIKRLRSEFDAHVQVPDSSSPERICTITADQATVLKVVRDIIPRLEDFLSDKDTCELRMLIHQSHAGGLIGRGGSKIKELREKYNARLKIFSHCAPSSTDRVLVTSGEVENCLQIVENVMSDLVDIPIKGPIMYYSPYNYDPQRASDYGGYSGSANGPPPRGGGPMRGGPPGMGGPPRGGNYNGGVFEHGDYGYRGPPPPAQYPLPGAGGYGPKGGGYNQATYGYGQGGGPVTTAQVTIPSDLGGTIIGRGGERIAKIRQESGAQITLEQSNGQPERIITITGTEQQIHAAQYMLQQCVRNSTQGRERFGNI